MKSVWRMGIAMTLVFFAGSSVWAQSGEKRLIGFDDLIKMHRVGEPQISPDGKWVAYTVATPDMEANRNASNIWLVGIADGASVQLTQSGKDSSPVWSPGGK